MTYSLIVPDIHGSIKMLDKILLDFPIHKYIFLGDIFDRGIQVSEVMKKIRKLVNSGRVEALIYGNHEVMTYNALKVGEGHWDMWIKNGGDDTLNSYSDLEMLTDDLAWYLNSSLAYFNKSIESGPLAGRTLLCSHASPPRFDRAGEVVGDHHIWDRPSEYSVKRLPAVASHSIHGHTPIKLPTYDARTGAAYMDLGNFFSGRFAVYCPEKNEAYTYGPQPDGTLQRLYTSLNFIPVN